MKESFLCRSKGITVDRSIAASVDATIDATRIRSVLFSLLDNAIKATPAEGRITIVCRTRGVLWTARSHIFYTIYRLSTEQPLSPWEGTGP